MGMGVGRHERRQGAGAGGAGWVGLPVQEIVVEKGAAAPPKGTSAGTSAPGRS